MSKSKVFISFRMSDGSDYKDRLSKKFEELDYVINKSEDVDRGNLSEDTIQKYLYEKLADSSLTVVILSPEAVDYRRDWFNNIDDWLYDELRYSLEDRSGNRTNGAIALYTPEAKSQVIARETDEVTTIADFSNLVRKNMLNVKSEYKYCPMDSYYNSLKDNYISLVAFDTFMNSPKTYINSALEKRDRLNQFNLTKRMS